MSEQLAIDAKLRSDLGKGASRRLRRNADEIPAIIYGAGKDPSSLTLVRKDLEKALENEAFFSQVIDVNVDGDGQLRKYNQCHANDHGERHRGPGGGMHGAYDLPGRRRQRDDHRK